MPAVLEWVKLHRKFATSSIMECSIASRYFFQMAILLSDTSGKLTATVPSLARMFNMEPALVEICLEELGQADPTSNHKEHDGRRIIKTGENEYLVTTKRDYNPDPTNKQRQADFRDRHKKTHNEVTDIPVTVTESREVTPRVEESRVEERRKEQRENSRFAPFSPPSVDEVRQYVREKGYAFEAETFHAFYESKGWMVGRSPMRRWRAACTVWQKRRAAGGDANGPGEWDSLVARAKP